MTSGRVSICQGDGSKEIKGKEAQNVWHVVWRVRREEALVALADVDVARTFTPRAPMRR